MVRAFRTWFTQAPRPHGAVDEHREVSFLELFYDLVFVVLISRLAHSLADDVHWAGVRNFLILFGLVWIAWLNGSAYQELHGREDGRSRVYIFGQMFVLVVLAVYAGGAAEQDGRGFAIGYCILLVLLTLQWYLVRRIDSPEYSSITGRYLVALLVSIAAVGVSIPARPNLRLIIWSLVVALWVVGGITRFGIIGDAVTTGIQVTASMAERFGLLVIIVLGEAVAGVANGVIEGGRHASTFLTGSLALVVGFGYWWTYFDLVGLRIPKRSYARTTTWIYVHLPLTAAIAAGGAGIVSLLEHGSDPRVPIRTSWLLSGSTAALLICLAVMILTFDYGRDSVLVPRVVSAVSFGALLSLFVGAMRPNAWLLALLLALILTAVWSVAFALQAGLHEADQGRPD